MNKKGSTDGVVHDVPSDLQNIIDSSKAMQKAWEGITPLARNEWMCWIESAKKQETRNRRVKRTHEELIKGKRRPCCWAGCIHR